MWYVIDGTVSFFSRWSIFGFSVARNHSKRKWETWRTSIIYSNDFWLPINCMQANGKFSLGRISPVLSLAFGIVRSSSIDETFFHVIHCFAIEWTKRDTFSERCNSFVHIHTRARTRPYFHNEQISDHQNSNLKTTKLRRSMDFASTVSSACVCIGVCVYASVCCDDSIERRVFYTHISRRQCMTLKQWNVFITMKL